MTPPEQLMHAFVARVVATIKAVNDRLTGRIEALEARQLVPGRDGPVGPHPKGQFEIHFREDAVKQVVALIESTGLTALVHPLTDDDLADHTSLGQWIGEPLPLDLSVLDPPGMNQGVARFGKSDF